MPGVSLVNTVCDFLEQRNVPDPVIRNFRENKVDKEAVVSLSDEQLKSLGLHAIGDIALLRVFCRSDQHAKQSTDQANTGPKGTKMPRDRRSKILKRLLEESKCSQYFVPQDDADIPPLKSRTAVNRRGRPRRKMKPVSAGLRLDVKHKKSAFRQIPSPLGDKNTITLELDYDIDYDKILGELVGSFFPDDCNPILGPLSKFNCEVVNVSNANIKANIHTDFTLWNYLVEKKAVAGKVRLHLLCHEKQESPSGAEDTDDPSSDMQTSATTGTLTSTDDEWQLATSVSMDTTVGDVVAAQQTDSLGDAGTDGASAGFLASTMSSALTPGAGLVPETPPNGALMTYINATPSGEVQFLVNLPPAVTSLFSPQASPAISPIQYGSNSTLGDQHVHVAASEGTGPAIPDILSNDDRDQSNSIMSLSQTFPSPIAPENVQPDVQGSTSAEHDEPSGQQYVPDYSQTDYFFSDLSQPGSSDTEPPSVVLADSGTDDLHVPTTTDLAKLELDAAFAQLKDFLVNDSVKISVHRQALLTELLDLYREPGPEVKEAHVRYIGEDGDDFGGLTKDLLTNFWIQALEKYFKGESAMIPHLPLHELRKLKKDYVPLGRILTHTAALCGFVPSRLSRSLLLALVFGSEGVSDSVAMQDFLLFVTDRERALISKACLNYESLTEDQRNDMMSLYSMFGFLEAPKPNEVEEQLKSIARSEMVDKPAPLVLLMRSGIPLQHVDVFWSLLSIDKIEYLIQSQRPTPSKVLTILKTENDVLRPEEEQALYLLKLYIMSLDQDDLHTLLLFITGSNVLPKQITIAFNQLVGFARRPIAHTCSNTLDLPVTYSSVQDLKREFRNVLSNTECFRMNAI